MSASWLRCIVLAVCLLWRSHSAHGASVASSAEQCRESQFPRKLWQDSDSESRLVLTRDFDGDGIPDKLLAEESWGNESASAEVRLRLSRSTKHVRVSMVEAFDSMVHYVLVPNEVVDDLVIRRVLEDALFAWICETPDPSLAWLLDENHDLRWHDGVPSYPKSYAIYSTRPEDLARVKPSRRAGSSGRPQAVWISYAGHNHARRGPDLGTGGSTPHPPRELARSSEFVLLGTSHGVSLSDPVKKRFAWIYVTRQSRERLRVPSVKSGALTRDAAVIQTLNGTVRIDLQSGSILKSERQGLR